MDRHRKNFKMINIFNSIIKNILTNITINLYHMFPNHITILHRTNIVYVVIVNVKSLSEIIRIGVIMWIQCDLKIFVKFLLLASITSREICQLQRINEEERTITNGRRNKNRNGKLRANKRTITSLRSTQIQDKQVWIPGTRHLSNGAITTIIKVKLRRRKQKNNTKRNMKINKT